MSLMCHSIDDDDDEDNDDDAGDADDDDDELHMICRPSQWIHMQMDAHIMLVHLLRLASANSIVSIEFLMHINKPMHGFALRAELVCRINIYCLPLLSSPSSRMGLTMGFREVEGGGERERELERVRERERKSS